MIFDFSPERLAEGVQLLMLCGPLIVLTLVLFKKILKDEGKSLL